MTYIVSHYISEQRLSRAEIAPAGDGEELLMFAGVMVVPGCGTRSLSGLGKHSDNSAVRDQILPILKVNSCSIDRESGEI